MLRSARSIPTLVRLLAPVGRNPDPAGDSTRGSARDRRTAVRRQCRQARGSPEAGPAPRRAGSARPPMQRRFCRSPKRWVPVLGSGCGNVGRAGWAGSEKFDPCFGALDTGPCYLVRGCSSRRRSVRAVKPLLLAPGSVRVFDTAAHVGGRCGQALARGLRDIGPRVLSVIVPVR